MFYSIIYLIISSLNYSLSSFNRVYNEKKKKKENENLIKKITGREEKVY